MKRFLLTVSGMVMLAAAAHAQEAGIGQAVLQLRAEVDGVGIRHHDLSGRIQSVYGKPMSFGQTPEQSAERFLQRHAPVFGDVATIDYHHPAGDPVSGMVWLPDENRFKFTLVSVGQFAAGIPVYHGSARLLVRNDLNYPLVLVNSGFRDLRGWRPAAGVGVGEARVTPRMRRAARQVVGAEGRVVGDPQYVIWAGVDEMVVEEPRVAVLFDMEHGTISDQDYDARRFLADAETGAILHQEPLVHHCMLTDVFGNSSGNATTGWGADICGGIEPRGLPYARVNIGTTVRFADAAGDFLIPNSGSSPVTVESRVTGLYFTTNDNAGPVEALSMLVTPPGPANFLHNAANSGEFIRAQVNAYLHSNLVRDTLLVHEPNYPTIANQTGFAVNVNINQSCNAFYNGTSINFYTSGGGCSNTANSTVVYHEYGHHIVNRAGSGQGAFGEGYSDAVAVVMADDPCLGRGFQNNCSSCLRNANNTCQYDASNCTSNCGSQIHSCGRLYSGCVWDTRQNLFAKDPVGYLDTTRTLVFGSVRLRTSGDNTITPQITIDFLTIDDDDGDLSNGTPNYPEINAAFTAHNMPGPPLDFVRLVLIGDAPRAINPSGGTTALLEVQEIVGEHQPGTGLLHIDSGSGFETIPMNDLGNNMYEAVFPPVNCGAFVRYFFSVEATNSVVSTLPTNAPEGVFTGFGATSVEVVFTDEFETHQGWSVQNEGSGTGTFDGPWERAIPITNCDRGNPRFAAVGDWCYVTDNSSANSCNSDVDHGWTRLISPVIDATAVPGDAYVSYWRWYSNTFGSNPMTDIFEVDVSSDGGTTWVSLEVVGPAGSEVSGGWFHKTFRIADFIPQTSQFRIRFIASDIGPQSVVEAGVDGVEVFFAVCDSGTQLTDLNIVSGTLVSGGLDQLRELDNDRLVVDSIFGFSAAQPNLVHIEVGAQTTVSSPSTIDLAATSRINNPGGTSRLRLFNWNTNTLNTVHEYPIGQTEITETKTGINAANYVRSDGRIVMANRIFVVATFSVSGFRALWDQVVIEVNE